MPTPSFIEIQNLTIPCGFVTALSYAKNARLKQTAKGYNRARGFEPAELSLRLLLNAGVCSTLGENYQIWIEKLTDLKPVKDSIPTPFYIGTYPLYSSLNFALTSINKTVQQDQNGYIYEAEFDLVFSGVSCVKESSRERALNFSSTTQIPLPEITLSCNGKSLKIESDLTVVDFLLMPSGGVLQLAIGDGLKDVERSWMTGLLNNHGQIYIDKYCDYYIYSADIVDDIITLNFSVYDVSWNQNILKSYRDTTLQKLYPEYEDKTGIVIDYLCFDGTKIEMLEKLQKSLGFIIDHQRRVFVLAPSELKTNHSFSYYYDSDLKTESISRLIWRDGIHEFSSGSDESAVYEVKSCCLVSDSNIANSYLDYVKIFQNEITITAPLDDSIREWSVISIVKNTVSIPCFVSNYEFDFLNNEMKLTLNYIIGGSV